MSTAQDIEHSTISAAELGIYHAPDTWKLELVDNTEATKDVINTMEYTFKLFEEETDTNNLNENAARLWFWKNISFVFSIGSIFEKHDHDVFDQLMLYFDRHQDSFFPNEYFVYHYNK